MEEEVRKERVNLIGGLKLKQLNDPNHLKEPKGFEFDASYFKKKRGDGGEEGDKGSQTTLIKLKRVK